MASSDRINDVKVDKLDLILDSGDVVSLLDLYTTIDFYQDLFGDPLYCEILITDALDLYSSLPIKNNEILNVEFNSPSNNVVEKKLRLISKENVILSDSGRVTTYKLGFVSEETIQNASYKVSRSYTGTLSNIVGALWSDNFGDAEPIQVEDTKNEYTMVLPYDSVFSHIFNLSKKARRKENENSCSFMFFEDFRGFNFVSLPLLFNEDVKGYYSWELEEASRKEDRPIGVDYESSRFRITEIDFTGRENLLDQIQSGMYNSYVVDHDIKNKTIAGSKHEYSQTFGKVEHANGSSSFPLNIKTQIEKINVTSNVRNHFSGFYPADIMLLRQSQVRAFTDRAIRFKSAGNSSLNVGDKIKVRFTKQNMTMLDSSADDKYRSGFYIISSIKHSIIKGEGYTVTVEASSDCYPTPIPDESSFTSSNS